MRPVERPVILATPQDLLSEAAELVEVALSKLDAEPDTCPCCGRVKYGNWAAHLTMEALTGIPAKLRRASINERAFRTTNK